MLNRRMYIELFAIHIYEFMTFHLCLQAWLVHVFEQQHKRIFFQKHDLIWSRKRFHILKSLVSNFTFTLGQIQ